MIALFYVESAFFMADTRKSDFSGPLDNDFRNLESLYRVYGRYAFGLAFQHLGNDLAEDIVHEAFLRFWREPSMHTLKGAAFFGWLLQEVQQLCWIQLNEATSNPTSFACKRQR
jgi:DNA-directed RNA polymerase specialized sigma24 family protein